MIYKKRIITFPENSHIFLFGVRGSGKTALLNKRFPSPKSLHIDLLDESLYQSLLSDVAQFYEKISAFKKAGVIIVDEIQKMPRLLNEVHRLIEESSRGEAPARQFILTGSSARKLKAPGVNLLAGRANKLALHPFVPEELGGDFNLNHALRYGLLPIVWSHPDRELKLKSYVELYLKEEIQSAALVRNLPSFARFLEVAGLYHGQAVNMSAVSRECQTPKKAVRDYFSILEDTLLGFFLPAYTPKLKLREKKHKKFYFVDPGLARALRKDLGPVSHIEKGALFEGLIAQVLRAYRDYNSLFEKMYYWSPADSKQTEVDFLLKKGGNLTAIEVKAKAQVSSIECKGLKAIQKLPAVKKRILVYMGESIRRTEDGIDIWPFDFFCQNLQEGNFNAPVIYKNKNSLKLSVAMPQSNKILTPKKLQNPPLKDNIDKSPSINEDAKLKAKEYQIFRLINSGKILKAEEKLNLLFEKNENPIINLILKAKIEKAKALEGKTEDFKSHKEKSAQYLKKAAHIIEEKTQRRLFEDRKRLEDIQQLIQELYHSKMYKEAQPLLEKITKQNLNDPKIFALLHVYFEIGQNEKAIKLAKALQKKFPKKIFPANVLFLIYEDLGEKQKAIQCYEDFIKRNPDNSKIKIELSLAYIRDERPDKAKALLNKPFDLNQLAVNEIGRLALAYNHTGQLQKALDILYQSVQKRASNRDLQQFYLNLFLFREQKESLFAPKEVGADCYLKIKELKTNKIEGITIEESADIYTPNHPFAKKFLSEKAGNVIHHNDKQYKILEIKNKYAHKYQEILNNAEKRFPIKPFIKKFIIPKPAVKKDITQALKLVISDTIKQREKILQYYKQGRATLSAVSLITGAHPIEIISALSNESSEYKFISSFPGLEDHKSLQKTLNKKTDIIIDPSSLVVLHSIKIEKYFEESSFNLYICPSAIESIKELIQKMKQHSQDGLPMLGIDNRGQLEARRAPSEIIQKNLHFLEKILKWAKEACSIKTIPADYIQSRHKKLEAQKVIGKEFLDPLLSSHNQKNAVLLSEDGAISALSKNDFNVFRARLWDIIHCFKNQLIINKSQANEFIAELIRLNQEYIPVNHELLLVLLKKANYSVADIGFQRGLYFVGPVSDLQGALEVISQFLKELFQEPALLLHHKELIAQEALNKAYFGRRHITPLDIAIKLKQSTLAKTVLLPLRQKEIENSIDCWLKNKIY